MSVAVRTPNLSLKIRNKTNEKRKNRKKITEKENKEKKNDKRGGMKLKWKMKNGASYKTNKGEQEQ